MSIDDHELRVPPHDIAAEMGVLGSMLLSPEAIHLARERLTAESFYRLAHQEVFDAVVHLADRADVVDLIMLRDELQRRQVLDKVGGDKELIELMEAVPTSANAEHYIEIVREHAVRRRIIRTCTDGVARGFRADVDAAETLDQVEASIMAMRDSSGAEDARDVPSIMDGVLERLQQAHEHAGQIAGIPTGFYDLDDITGGLRGGDLIVLAARPSQGKTSLALNILHQVCHVQRRPAALFIMEMPAEQIVANLLCIHNKLDTRRFRDGSLDDREWKRLKDCIEDVARLPLYIDDSGSQSIMGLRARARRLVQRHHVELIVVDYLQLMTAGRSAENRAVEVGLISHGLKGLARELKVPIIAVAQLNRRVEQEGRRPRMSDLRESGAIEQDADLILLLHRPNAALVGQDDGTEPDAPTGNEAELIVAKHRNGPTGLVRVVFQAQYLRFESAAHSG